MKKTQILIEWKRSENEKNIFQRNANRVNNNDSNNNKKKKESNKPLLVYFDPKPKLFLFVFDFCPLLLLFSEKRTEIPCRESK